jgi:AcrR family transcriptional regulator
MVTEPLSRIRTETRSRILTAAAELFGEYSYDGVTMRQVASKAGCSHTVIYQYFTDKDALLSALAMPVLEELERDLQVLLPPQATAADVLAAHRRMIGVVFHNRRLARLWLLAAAHRVDLPTPANDLAAARQRIFDKLGDGLASAAGQTDPDHRLELARIYVYLIAGLTATYESNQESAESLEQRLGPTTDRAVQMLIRSGHQEES